MILFLVSTCGELETIFPSNGSYQVRTLVNGAPIEECSIIRSGDKIRPYFAVSVVDDPDLIGLLVYFQDSQGKIVGEKIKYTIRPDAEDITQTETDVQEEEKPDETIETIEADELDEADDADKVVSEDNAEDPPETEVVGRGTWSFFNIQPKIEENTEVEIAVKSLAQELPYFPLPANLEIGSYTLVFEALGNRETLSRTEINIFYLGNAEFNLKDIAMYLPGLSGSQLISPGTKVMLETKLNFDTRLDPYIVWYNGKNIIKEGKITNGAGNILWTAPEQAGFYSLRLEAFPFQQRRNVTGVSREIALPVSPKAVDMGYFYRNDSKYTAQSPLAAGTAYPKQLQMQMQLTEAIISEESDDAHISPPIPPSPPELFRWYQFEGSLDSSMPLPGNEQSLLAVNDKKTPRWAGAGQTYGLSTGSDDMYQVSPVYFFQGDKDQGGGIFLSHIRLPAEGTILSVFFPLHTSSNNGVWLEMICEGNIIALILSTAGGVVEIPVYLDIFELQGFIPVVTEFYIRPYRLEAKITLGEGLKSNEGSIGLPLALSGEGRIRLGGLERFRRENRLVIPAPVAAVAAKPATAQASVAAEDEGEELLETVETLSSWTENRETNTIWDEFAILRASVPLLPEEVLEESVEEAVAEEKPALVTETPVVYVQAENIVPPAVDEETGGDEVEASPVADTEADDPVQEPEMLSVLSEES
jgi:hypothetical protein